MEIVLARVTQCWSPTTAVGSAARRRIDDGLLGMEITEKELEVELKW